jgi:endonuclease/exonuclease/phosphatase family metal-dependent hydrolase
MRSGAFFFFLLTLIPYSALAGGSLCLQTFNVYGPAYASGTVSRLGRTGEALAQEGCDFVQLQELWKETQFRILSKKLPGRDARWADHLRQDRALTGLGTFVNGRITAARSEIFRANNGDGILDRVRGLSGVQKGFTVIGAEAGAGFSVYLVNAHTHPTDEPTRIAQMLQLTASLYEEASLAEKPLLFTADLNATPGGLEYAMLRDLLLFRDGYAEAHGAYGTECTYCADNPYSWSSQDRVIDFTLYRPAPRASLHPSRSVINLTGEGRPLSDHYGVRTDFSWEEREDQPLSPADSLVSARRTAALVTLSQAITKLTNARDPKLLEAKEWAEGFAGRLRSGKLTPSEARVFLTP